MAYKGYRKPFVFRGSDSETSLQYVGSIDTTTTGTTDSDDNTLATVGGFGVTHAVTSRKASPNTVATSCLLYTSPSPRDSNLSRMPSSA